MTTLSVMLLWKLNPSGPLIKKLTENIGEVPMLERCACNLREVLTTEVAVTFSGAPGSTAVAHGIGKGSLSH